MGGEGSCFFPEFNIEYFLKKGNAIIGNQSASCTTEPLFVSLSNTDLQRFCLMHKPDSLRHTHSRS